MHKRILPAHPDPGHYRKQAKALLKNAAEAEAQARIRQHHPRWCEFSSHDPPRVFKLADAQLVLAREHGFDSWPAFIKAVEMRAATTGLERQLVSIALADVTLDTELAEVVTAHALVVLLHASGSARYRADARQVASAFMQAGFCTLSVDLLTDDEELTQDQLAGDVPLLSARAIAVVDWLAAQPHLAKLPLGLWAKDIGVAAAIVVAGERAPSIRAIVSCGGRPDLAGSALWRVRAPTLLIAGGADSVGLGFNRLVVSIFPPQALCSLQVLPNATRRFDNPQSFAAALTLAGDWFLRHLLPAGGQTHDYSTS